MNVNGQTLYTVEKILDKSFDKGEVLYLTKWFGYDKAEDNTWEPIGSFKRCPWVVEHFELEQALAKEIGKDLINELGKLPTEKLKKLADKRKLADKQKHPYYFKESQLNSQMVLEHVNQDGQLQGVFEQAGYRLVVVDYYADWCGPCRQIAPVFEQLSNYYNNVVFAKVNVDNCRMTCQQQQIRAMPTFVLYVRGNEVDRLQGANPDRLRQLIDLHIQAPPKQNVNAATPEERQWLHTNIVSRVDHVKQYEDEVNQTIALSLIPVEEINQKSTVDGKLSVSAQALHLMEWFHDKFFKWVNNPNCFNCSKETSKCVDHTVGTADEQEMGVSKVEVYECDHCKNKTRFPRHNNPMILLETREGRCGEWANCFTLCCRAMGLEARYIHCTEDHVWTEVYDPDKKRWIHCDACEVSIDHPLLYEKGWKKEIRYAFAIAHDHVQDVTWRYIYDQKACQKRRTYCREAVLLNCMTKLNQRLEKNLTEERKTELRNRQLAELISFLSPTLNLRGSEDEQGRQSGSIDWRVARGEAKMPRAHEPAVISPTDSEIAAKSMIVTYDCVNDVYRRPNNNNSEISGFTSLMHQAENVNRKIERDWKMAYICRQEGSKSADFSWKFTFGGQKVKRAYISIGEFSLFTTGKAMATVCGGDLCTMLEKDNKVEFNDLQGAEYLELTVNLRGGDGDAAWQHAQLFRGSLDSPQENLRVEIDFE